MGYLTSGNEIVDQMGSMNLSGNVIPQIWYRTITKPNGKPYLLAITLLSDIVYWYRPSEVRDEQSGQIIGWKKRFQGDLLQKTYQQYANLFGESKRSVKAALDMLEELGVIKKIFRDVTCENGMVFYNLMYLELDVAVLYALTYPKQVSEETRQDNTENENRISDKEQKNMGAIPNDTTDSQKNAGGPTKFCRRYDKNRQEVVQKQAGDGTKECESLLQKQAASPIKNSGTNTKITTKTTNREEIHPIYPKAFPVLYEKNSDVADKMEAYRQMIKSNLEYDCLKIDAGCQGELLDEILDLMVETVSVERDNVRIGGVELPFSLVKSKFLKLNSGHIRYVMGCILKNTTKVRNIRSYLLTSLYNAPNTIKNYYQSEINHDLFHSGSYVEE